ncbi:MAG: histidinol dehydrogenase [Xanthomonadaceae bacterium]|nr:histidinol dehydrogenase [Xanthomonadaceae bacterium]
MTLRIVEWAMLGNAARADLLSRPAFADADLAATVTGILDEVRNEGDAALRRLTARLDGVDLDRLELDEAAIVQGAARLGADDRAAIDAAIATLTAFHDAGRTQPYEMETATGVRCARVIRPIDSVGLYVPGGSAPLPSTVLMLGVPSRLAGNPLRLLCTPPRPDGSVHPAILYAAQACGITRVFRIGGAQAIAALAFGTESVPRVAKLFGPGNAWVTEAKRQVALDPRGAHADLPAGPSELMVVADAGANASFIAADLLSQAEHGPDSQVLLVTDAPALAAAVAAEVGRQLTHLPRRGIASRALAASRALIVSNLDEAMEVANRYAPEHLVIATEHADDRVAAVTNAGSVFLGNWTPEALGDYCSGTNHVLPTYGHARACSGLAVADFEKRITVQRATAAGLRGIGPVAVALARMEGLDAHARAVEVRLDECG